VNVSSIASADKGSSEASTDIAIHEKMYSKPTVSFTTLSVNNECFPGFLKTGNFQKFNSKHVYINSKTTNTIKIDEKARF